MESINRIRDLEDSLNRQKRINQKYSEFFRSIQSEIVDNGEAVINRTRFLQIMEGLS